MQPQTNNKLLPSNFSILIVEDDLPFAIELDMLVREIGYQVKDRVDNSAEALEIILTDPPDLVLMDIQIKGRLTGIEVAEKVKDNNIPILFISGIAEKATYDRARATNFIGYLVKPVSKFSIRTAIELAIKNISGRNHVIGSKVEAYSNNDFLYFKKKGVFYKITITDILFIEADGDQTITHTKDSKFYSFLSLRALDELLNAKGFLKVHRSYLANITKATSVDVDNQQIHFNGVKVPFSRRMKKELLQHLPYV